jgi:hypothetical protein
MAPASIHRGRRELEAHGWLGVVRRSGRASRMTLLLPLSDRQGSGGRTPVTTPVRTPVTTPVHVTPEQGEQGEQGEPGAEEVDLAAYTKA